MQEFGTIQQYRESCEQLKKFKGSCASELKVETKKRQELEREEMKLKDLEKMIAHTRAMTDLKGKTAESEGKLSNGRLGVALCSRNFQNVKLWLCIVEI